MADVYPVGRGGHLRGLSPQEREAFATGVRERREASFETIRAAAATLLAALDDAQKARARDVLPGLAAHRAGMMRHPAMGMPFAGPGNMPAR